MEFISVLCYIAILFNVIHSHPIDDACKTPTHDIGVCVPVESCESITNFITELSHPSRPEVKALLQSYECGSNASSPKVCCPSKSIDIEDIPPLDVSNHKNLHLLPEDCGYLDTDEKIVGGKKTGLFEFPWMALLSYDRPFGPEFLCGGTIINDRYILTAAHCISDLKDTLIGVRVGEHNIETPIDCEIEQDGSAYCAPPYKDLEIEEIIVHPQYNSTNRFNDIGLIRVSPIDLSLENTRPICLPLGKTLNSSLTNKKVVVSGWGITDSDIGRKSPDLLKVVIPVLPFDQCIKKYKKFNVELDYRQLCAGEYGKDSCKGDSGGPLQAIQDLYGEKRFIQQGIVCLGHINCGSGEVPGLYTKTRFYMNWILDNLKP